MKHLPDKLTAIIDHVSQIFHEALEAIGGEDLTALFDQMQGLALKMSTENPPGMEDFERELNLTSRPDEKLSQLAHAYSVYLELINNCESAYRKFRLADRQIGPFTQTPESVIYVFTAHPTEARAHELLELNRDVENQLHALLAGRQHALKPLRHLIHLALHVAMVRDERPRPEDEAETIYSHVLHPSIIHEQIRLHQQGVSVQFRTWVGGDKDGHPHVDASVMKKSFQASRRKLVAYAQGLCQEAAHHASLTQNQSLAGELNALSDGLASCCCFENRDGDQVVRLRKRVHEVADQYAAAMKCSSAPLEDLRALFWLYPALVLALEVREDAGLVHQALKDKQGPIREMLQLVASCAGEINPKWYVRGLILSMVERVEDIQAGLGLVRSVFGEAIIPVVPLFETAQALKDSGPILKDLFQREQGLAAWHRQEFNNKFEIMLGYSDSSKESGVLASRRMIAETLLDLEGVFSELGLTPVYFHGSGGSVARGGGSLKEQVHYWPKSALSTAKMTVQGEMVARNFANPEIMRSQVAKICQEYQSRGDAPATELPRTWHVFSELVAKGYQQLVSDREFFDLVEAVTPYSYLDQLKIGSRPTKRASGGESRRLRAIPWILCWTQTRLLLPVWWGIGQSWQHLDDKRKLAMIREYRCSPFASSFMKALGFTLKKVELPLFFLYLDHADWEKERKDKWRRKIQTEWEGTLQFFTDITGQDNFLWFRPWLGESIELRSPKIHPLNVLQLVAFQRQNARLLRETVAGIASGMLTTG